MAAVVNQHSKKIDWGKVASGFNSLVWYDLFTSFVFRFMAKTSEPLLAAGVIISAIDFLQRGQLLAHNAELSLWWSIAQGVAMEVSVGPVLVNALDAREENDKAKAVLYASLSIVLAVVGSAMLLMQFGLSVAGLTESQISPYILWPLFVVRTVASIGYIALSCTKHKRFSGVSPKAHIAQTTKAFEESVAQLQFAHEQSMNAFMERVHLQLNALENSTQAHVLYMQQSIAQDLESRFRQWDGATEERLQTMYQGFALLCSEVKVSVDEQAKELRCLSERSTERGSAEPTSLSLRSQFQSPKAKAKAKEVSVSGSDFDKRAFIFACLTESPDMTISDIQRKATESGHSVSVAYISEIRKQFRSESEA